ncbi:MAG: type II toxin-antitoxin system VapC family toxin [Chloroflexota bacterium]|nr:type II toxin-antitoxin system VapC family toxin [Chloroflexota bacterium]
MYTVDWEPLDLDYLGALVEKYGNLPMSIADAIVILCAERHDGQVLTLDEQFSIAGRDPDIRIRVARETVGEEAFSNYPARLKIFREHLLRTCLPGCGEDEFVSEREQMALRARWTYGPETKTDRVTRIQGVVIGSNAKSPVTEPVK